MAKPAIELSEVDTLIEQKRINEALVLVNKYLQENPDDFDNARERITIIFDLRTQYKETADELVRILEEEPLNDKKKLDIIKDLESMEANPNTEEKEFIAKIKVSAQFTYFRALYELILEEATTLLDDKQYAESISKLSEGFVLYYEDFFEKGFDETMVNETINTLNQIKDSYMQYTSLQTEISSAIEEFNISIKENNITLAEQKYEQVTQVLEKFAELRNKNYLAGYNFQDSTEILKSENSELTDAFFLPFAYRLILGRGKEELNKNEANVIKAMDKQWTDIYSYTLGNFSIMLSSFSETITSNTSNKSFEDIQNNKNSIETELETLQRGIALGKDFLQQNELLLASTTEQKQNPYIQYENKLVYSEHLLNSTQQWFNNVETLNQQIAKVDSYTVPENPAVVLQEKDKNYSNFLYETTQTSEDNKNNIQLAINEINSLKTESTITETEENLSDSKLVEPLRNLEKTVIFNTQDILNKTATFVVNNLESVSSFSEKGSTLIKQQYEAQFTEAIPLINEANDILVASNPKSAQEVFESLSVTIDQDISILKEEFTSLKEMQTKTTEQISNSSVYKNNQASISASIKYLENLAIDLEDYLEVTEQRIRIAQQTQNEANLRLTEAERSLNNGDFATSRSALQKARTKFNESLSYQFSETLQIESDTRIAELGNKITFAENEIIVQKVREFITESRKHYYNSNFLQAENYILQAEAQWAITNIVENPEIISLKALITNALSLTTGRSIPATDPLYPEMSQTLNVAYQHYSTAKDLLDNNKRTSALEELELARNKIRDIQVLYPFHQEASLLALEIDKLINPVAFEEQFALKFSQAKKDYKEPSTTTRAYIDLLDLHKINPNYPGLKDFIYVVELELGIILPPPDYAALEKSTRLAKEAQSLYDTNTRNEINLTNARNLLTEAVELNPENTDALILLDRINTSLGGGAVVVLSSEAENLYQKAVLELSKGNTITAASLVEQLLQIPGVKNSAKIIDLKKRVDSLL